MRFRSVVTAAVGAGVAATVVASRRPRTMLDLEGKVALVTGGSRGLGFLLARELVNAGCRVAIVARDRGELERAQGELESLGGTLLAMTCDVGDPQRVDEAVQSVIAQFGGVDILINNAGIIDVGPIASMTHQDFRRCMDVMFFGVLNPTLAVLRHMRQNKSGSIVNITSIGGKISPPLILPYSSAKFAAVALSEGLHAELARDGIRVTTVVPGFMRTGSYLNASFRGDSTREYVLFSIADNLPFASMDAERAARRIILAARRGEAEVTLTVPALLAARFNGLFPGFTSRLMGVVNRLLPGEREAAQPERGLDIQERLGSPLHERLTAAGLNAARKFNEVDGVRS